MNHIERINIFKDTQAHIRRNRVLKDKTEETILKTIVYDEFFQSPRKPVRNMSVTFEELTTLQAAVRYASGQKTAVLNFANPVEPGGGILRGANAQEEYLCRASNLYNIISSYAADKYYNRHKEELRENDKVFIGTDSLIYSPGVTVFKAEKSEEDEYQRYTKDWFNVDVITCAAPFFGCPVNMNQREALRHIFERRIRNIFEAAIENEAEVIILGAWGCGAFNNPPEVVANSFREVLLEERYSCAFEKVVFAVKPISQADMNAEVFRKCFARFPYIADTGEEDKNVL